MQATPASQDDKKASGVAEEHSARILVVDDQAEIADFLSQMLTVIGYEAVTEYLPERALQRLEDEDFDVVISDFRMPEMTGVELFHAATAARPALSSRFIFLTGDLFNSDTEITLRDLGVPLLGKPFPLSTVEEVVAEVIARNPRS